jgi:hypothetical protein
LPEGLVQSKAFMETEAKTARVTPPDTKVSPIPSSNCFAPTLLV